MATTRNTDHRVVFWTTSFLTQRAITQSLSAHVKNPSSVENHKERAKIGHCPGNIVNLGEKKFKKLPTHTQGLEIL